MASQRALSQSRAVGQAAAPAGQRKATLAAVAQPVGHQQPQSTKPTWHQPLTLDRPQILQRQPSTLATIILWTGLGQPRYPIAWHDRTRTLQQLEFEQRSFGTPDQCQAGLAKTCLQWDGGGLVFRQQA